MLKICLTFPPAFLQYQALANTEEGSFWDDLWSQDFMGFQESWHDYLALPEKEDLNMGFEGISKCARHIRKG